MEKSMKEKELEMLFLQPKTNSESYKRLAKALMAYVYMHPERFNLHRIDEDTRSEFILWMYPKFYTVSKRYDAGKGNLFAYLSVVIRWNYINWQKRVCSNAAYDEILTTYAADECRYRQSDEEIHESEEWMAAEPSRLYMANSVNRCPMSVKKLLVLALKSCLFLDESHVQALSKISGYSEKRIFSYIEALQPGLEKRCLKLEEMGKRRNMYYIKAHKYRHEMYKVDKTKIRYDILEKQYRLYIDKWQRASHVCKFLPRTPTNRSIADVLKIRRSSVDGILLFFKKYLNEKMKETDSF